MAYDGTPTESLTDMLFGYDAAAGVGELTIPKLTDVASPKLSEDGLGSPEERLTDTLHPDDAAPGVGEFHIPKLVDAASPKVSEGGLGSPEESVIPNDGDDLVLDLAAVGGRAPGDTVLPYIEQRGAAADDGGIVIDWSSAGGSKADAVGVIAIITPAEHDGAGIAAADEAGFVIDWCSAGDTGHDSFPTETIHPLEIHSAFDLMF
jgi:hypothetical protein